MRRLAHGKTGSDSINEVLDTVLPTLATAPVDWVASQGTLTIGEPVTADDTMTIGTTVYTFVTGATAAAGQIGLGAGEAATKLAIVAAINGTDTFNTAHPLVSAAAFAVDACVITARVKGAAGDLIATTETFTHVSNVFDATTLGTTTAGVDGTIADEGEMRYDATNIYICIAKDETWRKIAHSAL